MKRVQVDWDEAADAPVELSPYDDAWPNQFRDEQAKLKKILSRWLVADIEHVGSTSIPGAIAKPVIDIMVPAESLQKSIPAIDAAAELGYLYGRLLED